MSKTRTHFGLPGMGQVSCSEPFAAAATTDVNRVTCLKCMWSLIGQMHAQMDIALAQLRVLTEETPPLVTA
jgi:hypothetical protein